MRFRKQRLPLAFATQSEDRPHPYPCVLGGNTSPAGQHEFRTDSSEQHQDQTAPTGTPTLKADQHLTSSTAPTPGDSDHGPHYCAGQDFRSRFVPPGR
ncbi:hypothetical protein [Streptomyces sp. NPDC002187]|uniref:hypothetical protein n=1 Tax=Streptomyces sp. NPDC002187 TaxID=3364637 RepID=UPI00369C24B7